MKFEPRTCPWCKLSFAPRTQSQQFCSIVCSSNGRKRGAAAQCDSRIWWWQFWIPRVVEVKTRIYKDAKYDQV